MNGDGEQFGVPRMSEVYAATPPQDAEGAAKATFDAVRDFVGDTPQCDDITCLALHRSAAGS